MEEHLPSDIGNIGAVVVSIKAGLPQQHAADKAGVAYQAGFSGKENSSFSYRPQFSTDTDR